MGVSSKSKCSIRISKVGCPLLVAIVLLGAACVPPDSSTTKPTTIIPPATVTMSPPEPTENDDTGIAATATMVPTPNPVSTRIPTQEPSDAVAGATVRLFTDGAEQKPGNEFEVLIEVSPGALGISAAELSLSFDPDVFEVSAMVPGELLGDNPLVALYEIDNDKGRLAIGLARQGVTTAPTPKAVVATASFKINSNTEAGAHELNLTAFALANQDFEDVEDVVFSGLSIKVE